MDQEESVLEKRYREKLEKLEKLEIVSEKWVDVIEKKLKNVEKQMGLLEKRDTGTKRKAVGSEEDEKRRLDPLSLLRCLITGDMMVDPVVAADGHTYERSAIEDLFAKTPSDGEVLSPVTSEPLAHRHLVPNTAVQAMTSQYTVT